MLFGSPIKNTTVIKDVVENGGEIENLYNFMKRVKDKDKRQRIFKDMMLFKYGLEGEKTVMFELKNSFIPMHIFHDVRIEDGEYAAQIDFVAVTSNYILILETKQLMGDIEITSDGDFIRYFKTKSGKYYKKEAIYSPLNQAERHTNLIRSILRKKGIIDQYPVVPIVVLANPKSIINKSNAPQSIAEKVCRVDQLTKYMKDLMMKGETKYERSNSACIGSSNYLRDNQAPSSYNYLERYHLKEEDLLPSSGVVTKDEINEFLYAMKMEKEEEIKKAPDIKMKEEKKSSATTIQPTTANKNTSLQDILKKYRLEQAKKYDISPAFIFSNKELEYLLTNKPTTAKDVGKTPGFGEKKKERHAEDIAKIMKENL